MNNQSYLIVEREVPSKQGVGKQVRRFLLRAALTISATCRTAAPLPSATSSGCGGTRDRQLHPSQGGFDLPKLAEELARLRAAMRSKADGTLEQDEAFGAVTAAEKAAKQGDGPGARRHLKAAGGWALGIAEKAGVPLAVEALKRAMG